MDDVTLYCGDCLEILPTLAAGSVDAVITDPPYGIDLDYNGCNSIHKGKTIIGDDKPFEPSHLLGYAKIILWGGNNYANRLPRGGWIVWDRRLTEQADRIVGSPFELAWCSNPKLYKMIRLLHAAAVNADGYGLHLERLHPTQKPIKLMERCIEFITKPGDTILDPYMGSGTTGVACVQTGRKFIGIEIDPIYYAIAEKRIREAQMQLRLPEVA